MVCLAGVLDSFATAAEEILPRMTGLRLSESTVERTTEAVGQEVGCRLSQREVFGPARDWAWHKDAEGKSCAYISIDATSVPQQGPGGAAAEGRMVTVAMVYNPVPDARECWAEPKSKRPAWVARYVASLDGPAAVAEPLRRQAAQVVVEEPPHQEHVRPRNGSGSLTS
jgi:hypothetical protein